MEDVAAHLAAVDIGGTKVTVSISSVDGILAKVREPTRKDGDERTIPRQVLSMIRRSAEEAEIPVAAITAVGISSCSPFKKREGLVGLAAPNLCGGLGWSPVPLPNSWEFIPLEAELAPRFPSVRIGNDCATAAIAEHTFGAARGERNFIYVTWSTGIGAAAMVDGRLLGGKHSNAMHLGHIPLHLDTGESYASGWQHAENLEPRVAGPAIARAFDGGEDTRKIFDLFRSGDEKASGIIRDATKVFARALAAATTLLDNRLYVLGGSVMNDWDVLEPLVSGEFFAANPIFVDGVEFRRSELESHLGDLAGLSLVMPPDWVETWLSTTPWVHGS